MREREPGVTERQARAILGGFLFRKDDVFKKVSVLSGGEKSRLALARLLLAAAEPPADGRADDAPGHRRRSTPWSARSRPTTGTLIFISHDVYFIRALAQNVLHVHSGRLTPYAGDYDYYLDKSRATNERAALTAGFTDARPAAEIAKREARDAGAAKGPREAPEPGRGQEAARRGRAARGGGLRA